MGEGKKEAGGAGGRAPESGAGRARAAPGRGSLARRGRHTGPSGARRAGTPAVAPRASPCCPRRGH
ncbi:hypothetical protein C0Q57_30715 [Streptomyces albidoflavus]|nr:hypothetical protein C0Q57_30715 [Streptomyces albidoflavus]